MSALAVWKEEGEHFGLWVVENVGWGRVKTRRNRPTVAGRFREMNVGPESVYRTVSHPLGGLHALTRLTEAHEHRNGHCDGSVSIPPS
jgi:hypothetical protein